MKKPAILVVEGDEVLCPDLKSLMFLRGYELIETFDRASVLQIVRTRGPELVLLGTCESSDLKILEVAREIRRWDKSVSLILIATKSSEDLAVAALRAGINDYFKKPFSLDELLASIEHCLANKHYFVPPAKCATTCRSLIEEERIIGMSPPIRAIKAYIAKMASTDSTVLITGETGTGKELVAELIHRNSSRNKKPFVCVNCAALPDTLLEGELFGFERGAFTGAVASQRGKFELAEGGTIFLDEIGEMNLSAQAKILRTIESKEIYRLGGRRSISLDVRVIAATNQNLEQLVAEKKFRNDLYFRLNVARIHLLPLRDRKEDIPHLLDHYIRQFNRRFGRSVEGFTEDTLTDLLRYDWPGNVRELKNLCEAIFINLPHPCFEITFMDLPEPYQRRLRDTEGQTQDERVRLLSALFTTNWNISEAAKILHWSRMTVYRKIAKHHISKACKLENATAQRFPAGSV